MRFKELTTKYFESFSTSPKEDKKLLVNSGKVSSSVMWGKEDPDLSPRKD